MPEKELTEKLMRFAGKNVLVKTLGPNFLRVEGTLSYLGNGLWKVVTVFEQGTVEFYEWYIQDINNNCITLEFPTNKE